MKKACPWFTGFYTSHGNMHDKQITDKHLYDPQLKKKERAVTTRLRVTLPKFAISLGYANLRTHQNHYRSGWTKMNLLQRRWRIFENWYCLDQISWKHCKSDRSLCWSNCISDDLSLNSMSFFLSLTQILILIIYWFGSPESSNDVECLTSAVFRW